MEVSRRRFLAGAVGAGAGLALGDLSAVAGVKTVRIICRQAWGADPPSGPFRKHAVRRLTVHHPAVRLTDNRDAPQRFRNHQAYHQSLGWPDIAYHILIDRHGHVYEGRPRWARGDTNTDYNPRGHLSVLCEGDFEVQKPTAAMMTALVDVLAWACERYGVPPARIRGHRDYASTLCPGRRLYARIEGGLIRRRVKDRLQAGGVRLVEICGQAGKELVEDIENGTD